MMHAAARVLGTVLTVLALSAALPANPASADDAALGWTRLQPADGKTDEPVIALTKAACPADTGAVVVKMTGPGIKDGVGNLVGVTRLQALEETVSGQLWIPLQFVFDQWFLVNSVTPKPGADYTINVICRDLARSSQIFGTFVGTVSFDGKGGYKAVGDTAKPFDTELKPTDPLLGGGNPPSPAASSKDASPSQGSTIDANPSDAPTPDSSPGLDTAQPGEGSTSAASPSRATAPSDNTARNVVLGGSLVLLLAIGVTAMLGRLRGRGEADAEGPTGRRERDRVDSL